MLRILLASLVLSCCASSSSATADFLLIEWRMVDNPARKVINLEYTNSLDKSVCMSVGDWPNRFGKVNQMSETTYLMVQQRRFPIRDFNTGYCVGEGCTIRVVSKMTIYAVIPYEEFDLPDELRYERKSLIYPVTGNFCD